MKTLLDHEAVFQKFFDLWYDDEDRQRKGFNFTRPDVMRCYKGDLDANLLSPLSKEGRQDVSNRIRTMVESARADWPQYLPVSGDLDRRWIEAFDMHYTRDVIASILNESDPLDFSNELLVLVCQFGATLGTVMMELEPRLVWVAEWPYWESGLYDPMTGNVIPPFHWAIKKFSEYGVDDGFSAKIQMCMEILYERAGQA